MTELRLVVALLLQELFKAESYLWSRSDCAEGRQALRRGIDLLRQPEPDMGAVQVEMSRADQMLVGKGTTAMQCLRRAYLHLESLKNNAPLERGA